MELEAYSRNVKPDFNILLVDKHHEIFSKGHLLSRYVKSSFVAVTYYCLRRIFAKLV